MPPLQGHRWRQVLLRTGKTGPPEHRLFEGARLGDVPGTSINAAVRAVNQRKEKRCSLGFDEIKSVA